MKSVLPNQAALYQMVDRYPLQSKFAVHLADVPVQLETLLLLELEFQEPSVDLRIVSQLVRNDLGATLQILRLAARQYGNTEECPTRIEDCISNLGVDACIEAVSARTVARDGRHRVLAEIWAHSREIAQYSKFIAEDIPEVNPDQAYTVGLFHAIGLLPSALGWEGCEADARDSLAAGLKLARSWSLPRFVLDYFGGTERAGTKMPWSEIVRNAHWRVSRPSVPCSYLMDLRPQLLNVGRRDA